MSCLHNPKPKPQPLCLQAVSEAEGLAVLTLILEQQLAEHVTDAEQGRRHSQNGQLEKVSLSC